MPLPENLDSIDLIILRVIATQPNATTRDVEVVVYLSRAQVLRRLRALREQGLVQRRNSTPGQTYRYELSTRVSFSEIEQANAQRLSVNPDPVAREALEVLLSGTQAIAVRLGEMIRRIENILR